MDWLTQKPTLTVRCSRCGHDKPVADVRWLCTAQPHDYPEAVEAGMVPANSDDDQASPVCATCLPRGDIPHPER